MTVRLSPQKVSKILRNYFSGIPQCKIAKKAVIDQSTVSIYSSRLKQRAVEVGLLAAGKEFGVFNEVNALRSLSVELSRNNLTVEEANQGLKIMRTFMKLGVSPEHHSALVKLCREIDDPGFIHAALKLSRIETEGSMSYEEVVSQFEKMTLELPPAENRLKKVQSKLKSLTDLIAERNQELTEVEAHLEQLKKDAMTQQAKLKREFENKRKELNVKMEEVKEVAKLKADLGKQGFDIPTFLKLAKEYRHGSPKG
jgi:DNA repair exonuclease SbcCD ATPase subunit